MLPGPQDRRSVAGAPKVEHAREGAGEQRREGLGLNFATKRRRLSVSEIGSGSEIDAEAEDDPITVPFEQDSGELLAGEHQVIGPLEHHRPARHRDVERLDQREAGDERESRRGRIVGAKLDQGAAVEVARRGDPFATLPPLSRVLFQSDEPFAFGGGG